MSLILSFLRSTSCSSTAISRRVRSSQSKGLADVVRLGKRLQLFLQTVDPFPHLRHFAFGLALLFQAIFQFALQTLDFPQSEPFPRFLSNIQRPFFLRCVPLQQPDPV